MNESDASRILLVRSIEETDRTVFPPSVLAEGLAAAANDAQPSSWFLKRACYLLNAAPHAYLSILRMARLPQGWNIAICAFAFLTGLGTNYLGYVEKIPLILNPIMALVAWNLLVYAVVLLLWSRSLLTKAKRTPERSRPAENGYGDASPGMQTEDLSPSLAAHSRPPWIVRVLFPSIWIAIHKSGLRFHATSKQSASFVKVARRFWNRWDRAARSLVAARWKRLLHCAALFLTLGAVAGMYIRGVFLRYEVIWASTFITDERTVSRLVDFIFGPAIFISRIAGRDLAGDIDTARLMGPDGDPAASWIHLFAVTAVLVIVVPRMALAAFHGFKVRRAKERVQIDFDDYFASLIRPQIGALIAREIDLGVRNFSQTMANFVCKRLYDTRVVPEMARFRETGGKISDLKQRIKERCEEFRDEISAYAGAAVKEFETSLGSGVQRIMSAVQRDFRFAATMRPDLRGELQVMPGHEFARSAKPIAERFTDAISVAISASVAVVLGSAAGGFGESLGLAIMVALFGTSGPVGFLMGALIGLIMAAGAWWFGRVKFAERIENVRLPGALVRTALWKSSFESLIQQGRTKCHEFVKTRVSELLSPLGPQISDEVWARIEGLWRDDPDRAATAHDRRGSVQ